MLVKSHQIYKHWNIQKTNFDKSIRRSWKVDIKVTYMKGSAYTNFVSKDKMLRSVKLKACRESQEGNEILSELLLWTSSQFMAQ